jgi:hypothetical protein
MSYQGGIDIEAWIHRAMAAPSHELKEIKRQFQKVIEDIEKAEQQQDSLVWESKKITNEKKIHPRVVLDHDC